MESPFFTTPKKIEGEKGLMEWFPARKCNPSVRITIKDCIAFNLIDYVLY
jgi:hypothetical protein